MSFKLTSAIMFMKERVEIERHVTQDSISLELMMVEYAEVKFAVGCHQTVTEMTRHDMSAICTWSNRYVNLHKHVIVAKIMTSVQQCL